MENNAFPNRFFYTYAVFNLTLEYLNVITKLLDNKKVKNFFEIKTTIWYQNQVLRLSGLQNTNNRILENGIYKKGATHTELSPPVKVLSVLP